MNLKGNFRRVGYRVDIVKRIYITLYLDFC
jgi:hypothetical protein